MENYRVKAFMQGKEYGLSQIEYDDDRGHRFELMKNQADSTIFPGEEIANLAIETHKRTRQDQIVESYILTKV